MNLALIGKHTFVFATSQDNGRAATIERAALAGGDESPLRA